MEKKLDHIAIIMDGNRRWAKKRGLVSYFGHKAGAETLGKTMKLLIERGVKELTVYAFSTENWKRDKEEVNYIMDLFRGYLKEKEEGFTKEEICFKVLGRETNIPEDLLKGIRDLEEKTKDNNKFFLNIAFNYGGRFEIIDAVKKIVNSNFDVNNLDETTFKQFLYNKNMSDPDLIIRTSGELRLSNFLLWEMAYSEFYFTDTLWPDFDENVLNDAIDSYQHRERRFGGKTNK